MFEPAKLAMLTPFLLWCWLMMMVIHEAGHVIAAMITGGSITEVVLQPFTISRTDVSPNPHPQFVAWSGPVFGSIAPLLVWAMGSIANLKWLHLIRFFAGFCLITNGAYLAIGGFDSIGDAGELIQHGGQIWQLVLFGTVAIPLGFLLWHGQGSEFGIGGTEGSAKSNDVASNDFYVSIVFFAITFTTMLWLG